MGRPKQMQEKGGGADATKQNDGRCTFFCFWRLPPLSRVFLGATHPPAALAFWSIAITALPFHSRLTF